MGRVPSLIPPFRRAASLLAVFLFAKTLVVVLRSLDGNGGLLASPWAPLALAWQDVWTALAFGVVDGAVAFATRGSVALQRLAGRLFWLLYAAAAVYAGFNVAVARVLGSPLTHSLLGAAGGALWDSIAFYFTPRNLLAVGAVATAAALLPRAIRRLPPWRGAVLIAVVLGIILALGPTASRRVETLGLHRNALAALCTTTLTQRLAASSHGEDRDPTPIAAEGTVRDLSSLAGKASGRNVVWIVLESTAAQYLRPWGAERDPTPNVSALAGRGVVFDSVYCAYPESIKGLFSTLCASYPAPRTDADLYTEAKIPCAPIASRLAAAGYRTALFHSGRFVYLGMQGVVDHRGFERLVDAGDVGGEFVSSFGVDEPSTVRKILEWIDTLRPGERFFLMYLPIAGHHPYLSPGRGPRPFGTDREIDHYASDLFSGDAAIGDLLAGLRARGLDGQTLYVVHGDHGEAFYQHEGNFAHTLFLYEENVHVPLLFAAPGLTGLDGRAPQIGGTIDIAPTILDLLGLTPPPRWQGRSLLASAPRVARFYTDHTVEMLGLRDGPWKVIHEPGSGRSKLFRLPDDPAEKEDLAGRFPDRVARYRDHLRTWSARQRSRVIGPRDTASGSR
ncbi:MAG: hypothetical protein EXR72_18685 [Myxococcales bacterium]|nr:hypothetical protein [Myxococcales bacterium]